MFDYPSISVTKKTNEENMQNVKSYLCGMSDNLNFQFSSMQNKIEELQKRIDELEGDK